MDFDSSSKFISSLGKFLQSLCNGYVEFDKGVEVIGHIYLSVDTGKKIDYILNEKVCKTDENSVTFISNSFHAQPAEKPKPSPKPSKPSEPEQPSDPGDSQEDEILILEEPDIEKSDIPSYPLKATSKPSHPPSASKRSYLQSFPQNSRPHHHKHSRSSLQNPNGAHETTNSPHYDPQNTASSIFPTGFSTNSSDVPVTSVTDMSCVSKPCPETLDASNPASSIQNIKEEPSSGVTDYYDASVKQEHNASTEEGTYDDPDPSAYYGDEYYGGNSGDPGHTDYSQMSGQKQEEFYLSSGQQYGDAGSGESIDGVQPGKDDDQCPVIFCQARHAFDKHRLTAHWREKHERTVLKFLCQSCSYSSKRKRDVAKHMVQVHRSPRRASQSLDAQLMANEFYSDPSPYTLTQVLATFPSYCSKS